MPRDFAVGKISVFWDVNDFPVPEGRRIREIVESTLGKRGYKGEVSITVYGETNPFSHEEIVEGRFTFVERSDRCLRLHKMLVDIGLWAVDNRNPLLTATILMVVAKNKNIKGEDTKFVRLLDELKYLDFLVLLVVPDDLEKENLPIPRVPLVWYWKSLLNAGKPIRRSDLQGLIRPGKQASADDVCECGTEGRTNS